MKGSDPTRWLPVDAAAYDSDETVVRRGVEFHVFLSPYDLPEAVRGRLDPAAKRFVIEFRYLSEERATEVVVDANVRFHVGKRSRRLQSIEVDVRGLGATQIALRIDQAIDSLPSKLRASHVPRANFAVAKSVFHRKQPELLATIA